MLVIIVVYKEMRFSCGLVLLENNTQLEELLMIKFGSDMIINPLTVS